MAIKYINTTSHSIKKSLESPFAGKHPKLISKGTKAAADEAAEVAAETQTSAQREQTERLAPEFGALGGGAFAAAQLVAFEATAAGAAAASKAFAATHEDGTPLEELDLVKDSSGGAETMSEVDFTATAPRICRALPWAAEGEKANAKHRQEHRARQLAECMQLAES
jgi:hypothetical protein